GDAADEEVPDLIRGQSIQGVRLVDDDGQAVQADDVLAGPGSQVTQAGEGRLFFGLDPPGGHADVGLAGAEILERRLAPVGLDLVGARPGLARRGGDDRHFVLGTGAALDVRRSLGFQDLLDQGRTELRADGVGAAEAQDRLRGRRWRGRWGWWLGRAGCRL